MLSRGDCDCDPVDGANSMLKRCTHNCIITNCKSIVILNEPSVFISPLAVIFPVCFSINIWVATFVSTNETSDKKFTPLVAESANAAADVIVSAVIAVALTVGAVATPFVPSVKFVGLHLWQSRLLPQKHQLLN